MKSTFLLPNKFKPIGWVIFSMGFMMGVWFLLKEQDSSFLEMKVLALSYGGLLSDFQFFGWTKNDIFDEAASVLIIVGALFVMFSKQKTEDEFISSLRLNALSWAVSINYLVLLVSILFVYEIPFFWVLIFNMFTILFIFILRFYWLLRRASKNERYEE